MLKIRHPSPHNILYDSELCFTDRKSRDGSKAGSTIKKGQGRNRLPLGLKIRIIAKIACLRIAGDSCICYSVTSESSLSLDSNHIEY